MHKIGFSVGIPAEIKLFQSLNHQEGDLKVQPLIKSGYYFVHNLSKGTSIIDVRFFWVLIGISSSWVAEILDLGRQLLFTPNS